MAVQIKSLGKNALAGTEGDIYVAPVNKTAIVKSIRLVNTSGTPATVNLFVRRATGGTSYSIITKDLILSAGMSLVDDSEITLEGLTATGGEDRLRGVATGGTVHYVISGVERDV